MTNSAIISASLPNLAQLVTYGEIPVGVLSPIGCVATPPTPGHAGTQPRQNLGPVARLDQAIDKDLTEDVYAGEINAR